MIRYVFVMIIVSFPLVAQAQKAGETHQPHMIHGVHADTFENTPPIQPTDPGQSAFAAIQEIVAMLDADPNTDWSKVDIDSLRRHLVDMNNVTLYAEVATTSTNNGVRFAVTGSGRVRDSIRRMVKAHAETMSGANGMTILASDLPEGAVMTVTVENPADLQKLKGLGFFGVMTLGMHHQQHHFMIATGHAPHH